jgi:hypothetical protein
LITHAAQGGDELAAITADWRARDEERRIYSDGSMARVLDTRGVRTIGMRHLRDLVRTDPGPAPAGAVSSGIR